MKNHEKHIHHKLIEACKRNSRRAQNEIYRLYYKAMYNTALSIIGNATDAEEVMQEAFISAFKNLEQFDLKVSFGAWLKRIVVNRSIDHIKKNKREYLVADFYAADEVPEETEHTREYSMEKIQKAVAGLPEGYRLVFTLYLLEGYDHDEISGILGITPSTSRSQLARAKKQIVKMMQSMN